MVDKTPNPLRPLRFLIMEQKPSVKSTVGCDLLKRNETEGSCISVQATLEIEDVCEVQTVWIIKFRTMCVCVCVCVAVWARVSGFTNFFHMCSSRASAFSLYILPLSLSVYKRRFGGALRNGWTASERAPPYGQCEMAATHRPHGDEDTR